MKKRAEQLKSLGDVTRLKIIRLLCEADIELCVCEIMDVLESSHSNISRQLKILRAVGLVEEQKHGKWAYYSLTDSDGSFFRSLLQTVRNIPAEELSDDLERLKLRLSLREGDRCVDGLNSKRWMAARKLIKIASLRRSRNGRNRTNRRISRQGSR